MAVGKGVSENSLGAKVFGLSTYNPPPHPHYQTTTRTRLHARTRARGAIFDHMRRMDKRVIRKRSYLWTLPDLAQRLGCTEADILELEERPMSELLLRYLAAVGYQPAFYPRRRMPVDNFLEDPQTGDGQ